MIRYLTLAMSFDFSKFLYFFNSKMRITVFCPYTAIVTVQLDNIHNIIVQKVYKYSQQKVASIKTVHLYH